MSLTELLSRARERSVEFPHMLSNHAPMAVVALHKLGASDARLEQWYDDYEKANGLVATPPSLAPISPQNWREFWGQRERESDYRAFFLCETRRLGVGEGIRLYVPHLVQGVAGSATHPLMRLAYAAMRDDAEEAGVALGYWCACYLPLPAPGQYSADTKDPGAVLASIGEIEGVRTYTPETDLLWHSIRAVAALPGFAPVVDRLAFDTETPRRMAATSLALFAATQDFAALHALTGLHWVRLVALHLDDPAPLYRAFWQTIASLVPKIGFPKLPDESELRAMRRQTPPPWAEIHAAAVASSDEHDISLVYSAWVEQQVWGDPLYHVVAARRVGLLS